MTNLDYYVCLDIESGMFFCASNAYIFDTRSLTENELDLLNDGSDSDRSELADTHGACLSDLIAPHTLQQD